MKRPRFDVFRAAFFLLACVVLAQVVTIMAGGVTCFAMFLSKQAEIGACAGFTGQVREMWSEVLAAVLALLLAARGQPPDNPPTPPPSEASPRDAAGPDPDRR